MARIEKRKNPPANVGSVTKMALHNPAICGVCRKAAAVSRLRNTWREIDICGNQECYKNGTRWVGNSVKVPKQRQDLEIMPAPYREHNLKKKPNPKPRPIGPGGRNFVG